MLVIECTTDACSVALFEDGQMLAGEYALLGRGHAEALVPMIARLPGQGHAPRIMAGRGPGSFTGVRIGLAAAQALGLAWGGDVRTYPTMALISAMARRQSGAFPVLVATTGGHGEWFTQAFDATGHPLTALASLPPEQAATAFAMPPGTLVAGNQAEALVARRAALGLLPGQPLLIWPDARQITALPASAFTADLAPLYGRAPDARLPAPICPTHDL